MSSLWFLEMKSDFTRTSRGFGSTELGKSQNQKHSLCTESLTPLGVHAYRVGFQLAYVCVEEENSIDVNFCAFYLSN